MFARKIKVDLIDQEGTRPCPIAWLDNYCMRSFTGRSGFDETLPAAEGWLEVSFRVDLEGLQPDMEDWLTRKFGGGKPIRLRLSEQKRPQ